MFLIIDDLKSCAHIGALINGADIMMSQLEDHANHNALLGKSNFREHPLGACNRN